MQPRTDHGQNLPDSQLINLFERRAAAAAEDRAAVATNQRVGDFFLVAGAVKRLAFRIVNVSHDLCGGAL